jgi:hypothetical protein
MYITTLDRNGLPQPGDLWQDSCARQYLVTGVSRHAKTNEALVVCRGCAPPHASIAYPIEAFLPLANSEGDELRLSRLGSW